MRQYLDPDGYARAQKEVANAVEAYRKVYTAMRQSDVCNFEREADSIGCIEAFRQRVTANLKRLQQLETEMKRYLQEYMAAQEKASGELGKEYMSQHVYGTFGTLAVGAAVSYERYKTYQFANGGYSFSGRYNDLSSFMQTDVYKDAVSKAGWSEVSNYGLMLDSVAPWLGTGKTDEYVTDLMENALNSILMGIPEIKPDSSFKGTFKEFGQITGIENVDKWIKQIKSLLEKYASAKVPWEVASAEPQFKELMDAWMDSDEKDAYLSMLKQVYVIQLTCKKVGAVMDSIEALDVAVDTLTHCFNSYAGQAAYLDSMEEALLNAGFASGPLHEKIDEMRELYLDDFKYGMSKFGDYVQKAVEGKITSSAIKAASKLVPPLKGVDFGLKTISSGAGLLWSDEIGAYKDLAGLMQYDSVLTKSYENYVQMMNDGIATADDMAQADRLFNILSATKAKEYEAMMTLCEEDNRGMFMQYYKKYYELTGKTFNDQKVPSDWEQIGLTAG